MAQPSALYIVTGTSRGIGEALALQLMQPEHELICISRSQNERLEDEAEAKGVRFRQLPIDLAQLSQADEAENTLARILERVSETSFRRLCLINNAGVLEPIGPAHSNRAADVVQHLAVNLTAPMLLTSAFLRMTRQIDTDKRIMHISSGAAHKIYSGWSAYCAGKAGLDHFTRIVHFEQQSEPFPTKVVAVSPGVVETAMQALIRSKDESEFPARRRFVDLYESGSSPSPDEAAARLLHLLGHERFGEEPVVDLNDWLNK